MQEFYINGLKIHDIADCDCPYFLERPIEGLEFPSIRTTQFPKSGFDGIHISNQFLGERRITLKGYVYGDNFDYNRKKLLEVCTPNRTNSQLNDKVITFKLNDMEYRMKVQCNGVKMALDNINYARFLIDLIAEDDYIFSNILSTTRIDALVGGGITIPADIPAVFEEQSGGSVIINNQGNSNSFPTLRLRGQLTNPRIENRTLGKWVALSLQIPFGSYLDIDMNERTIIQGDSTNQIGTKSDDSRFWWLVPGDNEIVLTTTITGENGYAQVLHRDAFIGV